MLCAAGGIVLFSTDHSTPSPLWHAMQERKDLIAIFVAIVPVAMDVLFKFWVFKARFLAFFFPPSLAFVLASVRVHSTTDDSIRASLLKPERVVGAPLFSPVICCSPLPQYLRNYSPDTQVILEEIDRH